MRGGARPNTGGPPPHPGPKLDAKCINLREWFRTKLVEDREEHYRLAMSQAREGNVRLLCRIYDKVLPTPQTISVESDSAPFVLVMGNGDAQTSIPYVNAVLQASKGHGGNGTVH